MSAIDGGTVVVTGASSGIGREIARQLAPRAAKLVLVARRVERLEALATELRATRKDLEVVLLPCDLGDRAATLGLVETLREREIDVDVLVNNAGVGDMGMFDRASLDKTLAMIELNVVSLTILTHAVLPKMVARGKGGILNISSGFGMSIMPGFAAYIATKHYVSGLSEALVADLAGTGVTMTQVCPGPVATEFEENLGNFTGQKAPGLVEITADRCARAAVRGFDRGRALVVPGIIMSVVLWINHWSPRFSRRLFARLLGRVLRNKQLSVGA
jgi:uncharacterized protein